MVYFVVYAIFAYLVILGVVLGEVANGIKPNGWQMAFFVFAPIFLPVYTGNWMFHVINPETKTQVKGPENPVKVEIGKP